MCAIVFTVMCQVVSNDVNIPEGKLSQLLGKFTICCFMDSSLTEN